MPNLLVIIIISFSFSVACNSQDFLLTEKRLLGLTETNGISPIESENVLISGTHLLIDTNFFFTYTGDPSLQLIGPDGDLVDSLSYPQFSYLSIVGQQEAGKTLGVA